MYYVYSLYYDVLFEAHLPQPSHIHQNDSCFLHVTVMENILRRVHKLNKKHHFGFRLATKFLLVIYKGFITVNTSGVKAYSEAFHTCILSFVHISLSSSIYNDKTNMIYLRYLCKISNTVQTFVSHALPFSCAQRTFEGLPSVTRPHATKARPAPWFSHVIGSFNPGLRRLAKWLVEIVLNPPKNLFTVGCERIKCIRSD